MERRYRLARQLMFNITRFPLRLTPTKEVIILEDDADEDTGVVMDEETFRSDTQYSRAERSRAKHSTA